MGDQSHATHADDGSSTIVAALDLGSNSIKMTLGRVNADGTFAEFGWASETVRLGTGVAAIGMLAEDRIDAAIAALDRFARDARAQGATKLVGVATEATRTAGNGPAFLERVEREFGWQIRSISGDEEAALTFRGLALRSDVTGPVVVADIGGGSTELIVACDGMIQHAQSLRLGSGSLTDRYVRHDPPTRAELDACDTAAAETVRSVSFPQNDGIRLIVVGGTGEYFARLAPATAPLTSTAARIVIDALQRSTSHEIGSMLSIPPARAHVLPAGVTIIRALCTAIVPNRIDVARSGIRTGLLLDALGL